ncbi:unnamed protein product [Calypogeia fissa]
MDHRISIILVQNACWNFAIMRNLIGYSRDSSSCLAMSYFTTTPLFLVLEAPQHVVDEKHPSHFKLGTTSGEYLGAFSQLAEAADRGVSSNGRLLDSFRTEVEKF